MFRFIIAAVWTTLFLILSLPIIFVEWIIGFIWPRAKAVSSQWIVTRAFKVLIFIAGTDITFIGEDRIPSDSPVLYVPNHRSIFDIIITYTRCPRQTGYVAKNETKKIPVFSIWMAFMNCQFLNRKDLRSGLKVILKCVDLIKAGSSICIFPEGTRNKGSEDLLPFHDGSLKIAEKANCPIIPVSINNTEQIFEAHFPKIKKCKVVIEYCNPIYPSDFTKEEKRKISESVQESILETYQKNKSLF